MKNDITGEDKNNNNLLLQREQPIFYYCSDKNGSVKMSKEDYITLKTFLLFLNYMPNVVRGIKGQDIFSSDISVDMKIAEILRQIK
jgi:hypothetical protein